MKYDFTTKVNRKGQGSYKWQDMYKKNPNVSEGVVPLSVADMEFLTQPELKAGLKKTIDEMILGYTGPTSEYKTAVISWMQRRHNFHIEADWIVNTAGVVPAVFTGIREFTNEGDGVIIMSPVYYPFYNAIKLQNRNIVDCPLIEKDGYYTIDYKLFDKLARNPKNKILLFCSPHNPVGRVWKKEELEKLSDLIIKNDLLLLSDEIHFDLVMPNYKHTVFQTLSDDLAEKTLTFTAPSKTFNIAGMGLSNAIIKNKELRTRFIAALDTISASPMTALGFKACEIVYNECEQWLEECLKVIDTNQRLLHTWFKANHPAIKAPLIEGTYLQWVDFRALGLDNESLENFMIHEAELFLDEGYIFGKNGSGFERFNLAAPTKILEEALDRLDRALKKLGK
ncbi:MalY/PatB family protein [Treponema phagedenis]|uniref:cysteine-S-conjugate beta-lyase n=1 Tax=Treponema phagedenis TaxID=162 RepID=A0AAE6M9F7_TREPH|nr:MalY/PatB family protein [Treponema phagedenis]QEJ94216.1 pyridoxal phosphate-dependent aminotransferase [Treponema phagedenis]QEJ99197.1 pyridoxal phosphate-dependent aminotransferase [Treponema phagedenis]QEK00175.1 pyridoxal phosphate-dependent aminotransferase [Treponema phagedenis]QSH95169.1 pyridoxal phosphate-dependent aminotransferase [Treponema phagedenis]